MYSQHGMGHEFDMPPGGAMHNPLMDGTGSRRRSLCGPETEEERGSLLERQQMLFSGCFSMPTSRSAAQDSKRALLRELYGNMAERSDAAHHHRSKRTVGGTKGVPSGVLPVTEGVKSRRSVGRYGSLASHRQHVMENGGKWGNMEMLGVQPEMELPYGVEMDEEMPEEVFVFRQTEAHVCDIGDVIEPGAQC
ncbi:hypothetical protein ERJ75_000387100 [Trypanosoma vivax]|nr:hypothetical protein TRVL_07082 [Trypanosoma vivax]KAH8612417.1 hypothetical protein ERJ75_000892200 [Trypanosoma vivax]KAH8612420.1 hypothetical protein ERJ75_000892800 [Trypanosoma vivax]KAH8612434.1 hypothetical protein ERJ75_000890800 [Trypanosoma vivax]KAH8616526.1 hypothetical protein ERJ75_000468600 [Trypanosoma vivax]